MVILMLCCFSPEDVQKSEDVTISRQFKDAVIQPILKVKDNHGYIKEWQHWLTERALLKYCSFRPTCHRWFRRFFSGSFPKGWVSGSDQWNRILPAFLSFGAAAAGQQRAQLLGQEGKWACVHWPITSQIRIIGGNQLHLGFFCSESCTFFHPFG